MDNYSSAYFILTNTGSRRVPFGVSEAYCTSQLNSGQIHKVRYSSATPASTCFAI